MVKIRFTGQDEIPLLASALNLCSPMEPAILDVAMLREEIAHGDLWWQGCLIAEAEGKVVAVLTTARRDCTVRVRRLRIHPDFRRRGIGATMLRQLIDQLPRSGITLVCAETPLDGSEHVFQTMGFQTKGKLQDYLQQTPLAPLNASDQTETMTVKDALAFPGLWRNEPLSWSRTYTSLHAASARLEALGLVTHSKVLAVLIFDADPLENVTNIWRFGAMTGPHQEASLTFLLRVLKARAKGPLRIPKLSESELPSHLLDRWGFVAHRSFVYLERSTVTQLPVTVADIGAEPDEPTL